MPARPRSDRVSPARASTSCRYLKVTSSALASRISGKLSATSGKQRRAYHIHLGVLAHMQLKGPNDEDVRKIHAEINQIANQRFLLITAGLSAYPFLALLLRVQEASLDRKLIFLVTGSLLIIHGLLYWYSYLLRARQRTFSSYLIEMTRSDWEQDWLIYRKIARARGYSRQHTSVFVTFGVLDFLLPPIFILLIYPLYPLPSALWFICSFVFLAVYLGCILYMDFRSGLWTEQAAQEKWKKARAILALKEGLTHEQVAKRLLIDEATVKRYEEEFQKTGIKI